MRDRVVQLVGSEAMRFANLTFPLFRPLLSGLGPGSDTVATGAYWQGIPVALALGRNLLGGKSEILSLFVSPLNRRSGIGTALLLRLEELLAERGCNSCQLVYMTNGSSTAALERLLLRCGWPSSQPHMFVFKFDQTVVLPSWTHSCTLPPDFEAFRWRDLTSAERIGICRSQEESKWIPDYLVPFQHEDGMDIVSSLGLRFERNVVGWVITHHIAPDTVRYTNLFLRKDLRRMGRGIALLAESIRVQTKELGLLRPIGICSVHVENKALLRFLRLHTPLADVRDTRGTCKSLVMQRADQSALAALHSGRPSVSARLSAKASIT